MLTLVRHGRPRVDPGRPASSWSLDPAGAADLLALRRSGRLPPSGAVWCSSPEPKARQTAAALTDDPVREVDDLREHERGAAWISDFESVLARAFADPDRPAYDGWEPLAACAGRVNAAVARLQDSHAGDPLVLVGHGTAWTVLVAARTGVPIDGRLLDRWRSWRMPDTLTLTLTQGRPLRANCTPQARNVADSRESATDCRPTGAG